MNNPREISKLPLSPVYDDFLIQALTELCFFNKPVVKPNLLFVFGSNILYDQIAEQIISAVRKFNIPKVIITGGIADNISSEY